MNDIALLETLSLLLSTAFLAYVVTIMVPYLRRRPAPRGDSDDFTWHLFVPCRDEEAVIGSTLSYLNATFPRAHLWIVDDDSDDDTATIVADHPDPSGHIHLVRRRRPDARIGKGPALNSAYHALDDWLATQQGGSSADRSRMIVGVVDADGLPDSACLDVCAADHLFGDPSVGAVQIGVRMVNRDDPRPHADGGRIVNWWSRLLVRLQDLDFQGPISAIQASRRRVGTVAMGGNGQFSRLSALDSIVVDGDGPWRGALLEDFELAVHLLLAGWRTEHTEDSHVDQEGLTSFRRFITQRTRWGQGTMQCIRYLPELWRSPNISHLGAVEIAYCLIQPWLALLGTVVFAVPAMVLVSQVIGNSGPQWEFFTGGGGWLLLVVYAVFGIGAFAVWGPVYRRRCEPTAGRLQSLGWGCGYWLYAMTLFITSWRAVFRIVTGRQGWAKTRRNAELTVDGPIAMDT
jgi:1,2-diacylglycerol 3-beta-glucosyltransferase